MFRAKRECGLYFIIAFNMIRMVSECVVLSRIDSRWSYKPLPLQFGVGGGY